MDFFMMDVETGQKIDLSGGIPEIVQVKGEKI